MLSSAANNKLVKLFLNAQKANDVEKAIERATVEFVESGLKSIIGRHGTVQTSYPHNTDGLVEYTPGSNFLNFGDRFAPDKPFSVLIESKKDMTFSNARGFAPRDKRMSDRATAISQVIHYYKNMHEVGDRLPVAAVISDNDELFVVQSKIVKKYLLEDYDWSLPPSRAHEDIALIDDLKADKNIASLFVYHIGQGFDFNEPAERLVAASNNQDFEKIVVNEHNLEKSFEDFNRRVFGGSIVDTTVQMTIYIQSLLGSENIYIHPNKKHVLVYGDGKDYKGEAKTREISPSPALPLDLDAYQEFFEEYDKSAYTVDEQKAITEIADTLIDEFDRRFHGDYWTPKIWVEEAHDLISKSLNTYMVDEHGETVVNSSGNPILQPGTEDWKQRYTVWDAACGSKNLTRDHKFGKDKLFLSTLHSEELAIAEDYNPEATSFQYDFLNDDINIHELRQGLLTDTPIEYSNTFRIPEQLFNTMQNKEPIVFFMNPPYGQATEQSGNTKENIANTAVGDQMRKEKYGHASSELYTQFIKRVQMFAETFNYEEELHFFFFNKGFLTSSTFKKFTNELLTNFEYKDGFMLNAGEFNGTSAAWGIIFSHFVLKPRESRTEVERQQELPFDVLESFMSENDVLESRKIDTWNARPATSTNITTFLPSQRGKKYRDDYPTTGNGFEASASKAKPSGIMYIDSIGYAHLNGSNVQYSDKYTGWYTMCFHSGNGQPVAAYNFEKIAAHYAIRKSWYEIIRDRKQLWIRDKDVFPAPTDEFQQSEAWDTFVADSVVYSLFASGSNQTSLRDYEYNGKQYDVQNNFFWKSIDSVKNIAQERDAGTNTENFNRAIQNDINQHGDESFVYNWLQEHAEDISPEAEALLATVDSIFIASFKYRAEYAELEPLYQLNTWDAGWLQIYKMCYSRAAHPLAKADETLQQLKQEFNTQLRTLGDKIATAYGEDTGF